ncbi:mesoderm induction early response protein 2 isoform X2 [Takifugu rubripes]|uniref:mesoderm induction early response protein 2 isoform X2 n=1 Tax=Takifugu rubripes TaxID=31033 RepID=UPI001145FCF6|nr:mesoderm induction early response protein 2 isoform X2 [Takifugu rubripes]
MRYRDEDPQLESQEQSTQELEENFLLMKMAAGPHTAGELSLEEMLALYSYTGPGSEKDTGRMAADLPNMTLDKDQMSEDLFAGQEEEDSSVDDLTPSVTSNGSDVLQHPPSEKDKDTGTGSSSDEDSDDACSPSNEEHKEIMVGSKYQAKIPPLGSYIYQERDFCFEDQLLWRPGVLPGKEVEEFLLYVQKQCDQQGAAGTQTPGDAVRDNEQALYELVKCNFNAEEALRRLRFNVKVFSDLCAWSEEECRNFEHGYRVYGKNFHLIQANKVRTRSVGECVEYYYMWKKSERHEHFTLQATRVTRKKFSLQPGNTDYGDQYGELGELDGSNNSSDLLSQSSGQPESPLPPQSSLDLDRRDGELATVPSDTCGDGCPFSFSPVDDLQDPGSDLHCPSAPFELQSPPSPQCSHWTIGSPIQSCHNNHCLCFPGSCFYQLDTPAGRFVPERRDCGTMVDATDSHELQVEFRLSPPASPPSSAVLASHFQAFGGLTQPSPVQHPHSVTQ